MASRPDPLFVDTPEQSWVLHVAAHALSPQSSAQSSDASRTQAAAGSGSPSSGDSSASSSLAATKGLLVAFQDVSYSVPLGRGKRATLISGITGHFEPGQLTAILGPSGSGKTTLLDVLAGRKTAGSVGGAVLIGGLPPCRSLLRRAAGYVEQQDTLVELLTVREMLEYTAQLKRPRQETLASKQAAVASLLRKLGLEGCAGTQVGGVLTRGISGGQSKRLNIGLALITDPRVLFLDEPTSGLDSATANEVMAVVAALAREGVTVASTIHSPSSYAFGLCDRLLVLAAGRTVYLGGNGDEAIAYFTSYLAARQPRVGDNLAEWMLETVTQGDRGGSAKGSRSPADVWTSSLQAKANASACAAQAAQQARLRHGSGTLLELQLLHAADAQPAPSGTGTSSGHQLPALQGCGCSRLLDCHAYVTPAWWSLKVLLSYRTRRNYRCAAYVLPRVGEKLLFALLVLSLYWGKGSDFSMMNTPTISSLLFLQVLAPVCAAMIFLPSMGLEKALFVRERSDGLYRPVTYLLFKLADELLLQAPVTAAAAAAVFFACDLQGSFALFWLMQLATLANGTALAYFLASASPSLMVAMPVLSFVLIVMLVLCGFMVRPAAVPAYWAWAVKANVVHWAWGGLMANQYSGHSARLGATDVLTYFGFAGADPWRHLGIVTAHFAAWTLLAWLALAFARTHRR